MSDAVRDFWKKWLDADPLDRSTMLQQLARGGLGEFLDEKKKNDEQWLRMFCNLWNSYFEDFYYVILGEAEKKKMHPAQIGTSVKKKGGNA